MNRELEKEYGEFITEKNGRKVKEHDCAYDTRGEEVSKDRVVTEGEVEKETKLNYMVRNKIHYYSSINT